MLLKRGMILAWLAVALLASLASADDDDPTAEPARIAPAKAAPLAAVRPARSEQVSAESPAVMHDPAVKPAQCMVQNSCGGGLFGFGCSGCAPGETMDLAPDGDFLDAPLQEFEESPDPDAPAPAISSGSWVSNGKWYVQANAVVMNRSNLVKNSGRLATDLLSSDFPKERVFLQIPLSLGFQPGIRTTVGRFIGRDDRNRDHSIEASFLGLMNWHQSGSITGLIPGGIFSDVDPTSSVPAYNQSNSQSFGINSTFNSYELNYRISRRLNRDQLIYTRDSNWVRQATASPLPSLFAGFRAITLNEKLNYLATSSIANGTYDVSTNNTLLGLQAGMDWFYERAEWRLGVQVKGGGMVNWDNQSSTVRILDANGLPLLPNRDESARDHILAFVGELNFNGAYQIRPNFAFRAGFGLLWLTDLALAQNQVTFFPSTPAAISEQHGLLFENVTIGLEWLH